MLSYIAADNPDFTPDFTPSATADRTASLVAASFIPDLTADRSVSLEAAVVNISCLAEARLAPESLKKKYKLLKCQCQKSFTEIYYTTVNSGKQKLKSCVHSRAEQT